MNSNKSPIPPGWSMRFFRWFCNAEYAEDIEGDLLEKYSHAIKSGSKFKADLYIFLQVLFLLRPSLMGLKTQNKFFMLQRHNFLISYRTLVRNKMNSFINIGGLSIGMTAAVIIGLWVFDELTYNRDHDNFDHLAKVLRTENYRSEIETNNSMVTGLGTLLQSDYGTHFDDVGMVRQRIEHRVLSFGKRKFTQSGYFVQPTIPEMFTLQMIHGSRDGLQEMNSILLSESLAQKLFGKDNPVGEIIQMDANWSLKVTGVYKNLPLNSELKAASYLAPLDRYLHGWSNLNIWNNYNMWVYVQLKQTKTMEEVSEVISKSMFSHVDERTLEQEPFIFLQPTEGLASVF